MNVGEEGICDYVQLRKFPELTRGTWVTCETGTLLALNRPNELEDLNRARWPNGTLIGAPQILCGTLGTYRTCMLFSAALWYDVTCANQITLKTLLNPVQLGLQGAPTTNYLE